MTEQLTVIGGAVAIIGVLWRMNMGYSAKVEEQRDEAQKEIREQHKLEQERLVSEMKEMKADQSLERKEYLKRLDRFDESLRENTQVLRTVAEKIEDVPKIQEKLTALEDDVKEIKTCINGNC